MKDYSIEQLDKMRNKTILYSVIGWSCWYGSLNAGRFMDVGLAWILLFLFGFGGWVIWTIYLIKMNKMNRYLKNNPRINQTLNDELYKANRQKSWVKGFFAVMIASCFIYILSIMYDIPGRIICELIIFLGVVIPQILLLIYNHTSDGTLDA